MIEIRTFHVGDVDALVALFTAVLPGFASSLTTNPAGPGAFLQDPNSFALGAYEEETAVGLAWGLQMRSPSGRLTTYLHELEVREEWRRRGIGAALISEAIALARVRRSTRFWLSTGGHNDAAQALYASLGGDRKPRGDVNYWWALD